MSAPRSVPRSSQHQLKRHVTYPLLNRKKSWHPLLLSNQQRVWEVEKKAVSTMKCDAYSLMPMTDATAPYTLRAAATSTKRRNEWINSEKSWKRNVNLQSYNDYKRKRRGRSERREWIGCMRRRVREMGVRSVARD